jgi:hypothetical protein
MNNFAPLVVGAETCRTRKRMYYLLYGVLQALKLLQYCLENYYNNVHGTARMNSTKIRKPCLWTSECRDSRRDQGWSQAGIEEFKWVLQVGSSGSS